MMVEACYTITSKYAAQKFPQINDNFFLFFKYLEKDLIKPDTILITKLSNGAVLWKTFFTQTLYLNS